MHRRNAPRARALGLLLAAAMAVGACAPLAAPPAAPTAPAATPTRAPRPTLSRREPTAAPLPSPTPLATQPPARGAFRSDDLGVSMTYPEGWDRDPPETDDELVWVYPPDKSVYLVLYYGAYDPRQSLREAAEAVRDSSATDMTGVAAVRDEAAAVGGGRAAWVSEYRGTTKDGDELTTIVTSAARGRRLFTLMAYGPPDDVDAQRAAIGRVAASLTLEAPRRFGIPEDQALLASADESHDPTSYDPAHGGGGPRIFSGLVMFTPDLRVAPDLAESWDVSPDGTVYTFHLRANARFHSGRPVRADDVIYSWDRAADPDTQSGAALTYLGDIVGVPERHAGDAASVSGLRAVDGQTLRVTIDGPKPYFLMKLTYAVAFVVDRANVESGPEWYRAPNGTGPYRLARWEPGVVRIYERAPDFYLGRPAVPYIVERLFAGDDLRLYEAGDLDIASVGGLDLERARDPHGPWPGQLREGADLCTSALFFDTAQPPFSDPAARRAFALAVDRARVAEIMHGDVLPAKGLYPPALPGYRADAPGQAYDPEAARRELAASSFGAADQLPPVTLWARGYGSDISGRNSALAGMWREVLGVEIRFQNIDPERWGEAIGSKRRAQLFSYTWCADYPDPENFADVLFHSGAEQNLGDYSSAKLDELLEAARTERDVARRIGLYQQAEQLLVDDGAAIFLTHSRSAVLVSPRVRGYVLTPLAVPIERYLSLAPDEG